ncbi:hypothetical protein P2R64_00240 [Priestia megaterium]|uniref:phage head completion protein n=1 Tax=Priestia megaterium TaxID=1404 RepID=UPI0021BF840D|nr:hypothetical protein [Priestia megaterium]MCT9858223.1 hypothetical protein [Priestia megaterium]MDF1958489.1 hypothetical protein [Priestia megaterium]
MNPGTLNKRLTINSVSDVSDGAGGYEEALTPIKTVWVIYVLSLVESSMRRSL